MLATVAALAVMACQNPVLTEAQNRIVRGIEALGGDVGWVREDIGDVLCVDFHKPIKSLDLTLLVGLDPLYALRVLQGDVRANSLKHLAKLPRLGLIVFHGKGVDDEGLRQLAKVKTLDKLDVNGATITGKGLAHLAKLTKLTRLYLYNTKIKDADLKALESLTRLTVLDLPATVSLAATAALRRKLPNTHVGRWDGNRRT